MALGAGQCAHLGELRGAVPDPEQAVGGDLGPDKRGVGVEAERVGRERSGRDRLRREVEVALDLAQGGFASHLEPLDLDLADR